MKLWFELNISKREILITKSGTILGNIKNHIPVVFSRPIPFNEN